MFSRRFSLGLGAALVCLCSSSAAWADWGELSVSGGMVANSTTYLGGSTALRLGISDLLALEVGSGMGLTQPFNSPKTASLSTLDLVVALDIFEWVPELSLGVGSIFSAKAPRFLGSLHGSIRWFIDFNWSVFGGVGTTYWTDDALFSVQGKLGVSYLFD